MIRYLKLKDSWHLNCLVYWDCSDPVIVLFKFQCRGVLLIWIIEGQWPSVLAVGVCGGGKGDGGGRVGSLIYRSIFLSPSL